MDPSALGKWIFFAGLGLAFFGLLVLLAGKLGIPLGKLPGDIRIERDGFSFYFPVVTLIVISVILTVVLNLLIRLLRK